MDNAIKLLLAPRHYLFVFVIMLAFDDKAVLSEIRYYAVREKSITLYTATVVIEDIMRSRVLRRVHRRDKGNGKSDKETLREPNTDSFGRIKKR